MKIKNRICLTAAILAVAVAMAGCTTAAGSSSETPAATELPGMNEPAATPDNPDDIDPEMGVDPEPAEADPALAEMLESIYAAKPVELSLDTRAVDLGDSSWVKYYTGLDDASVLDAAIASEPLIGSQAYSLVLMRCNDADASAEVAQQALDGANPRKWVCVTAGDMRAVACGDIVMLAMVDTQLADTVTADELVQAFTTAVGTPETDLTRSDIAD